MTQQELEALLGRPLTPTESSNFDLYLDIAKEHLEGKPFCIPITCSQEEDTLAFIPREGYSTIFCGIFTDLEAVKVNGNVTTNFYPAFWDDRNSSFYNSIVFKDRFDREDEVTITATWGFDELPNDLKRLWARAFTVISSPTKTTKDVRSKKVEDFSITYGDLSDDEVFKRNNAATIQKYSICNIGYVLHGKTCRTHRRRNCGYCL